MCMSYRPGTWCEGSIGEVGVTKITEVSKVWDHKEGIASIRRRFEESSILLSPQS